VREEEGLSTIERCQAPEQKKISLFNANEGGRGKTMERFNAKALSVQFTTTVTGGKGDARLTRGAGGGQAKVLPITLTGVGVGTRKGPSSPARKKEPRLKEEERTWNFGSLGDTRRKKKKGESHTVLDGFDTPIEGGRDN